MNTQEYQRTPIAKGLGVVASDQAESAGTRDWNLLREDLSLPAAVLYDDRIEHNLRWMQRFIERYQLQLAPHGKTTMTPKLFARQLAAGAWGITLATAQQTAAAFHHGVRRVLMANQLAGKQNMKIIAGLIEDPSFQYFCLVDSAAIVDQLGTFFREHGTGQRLQVLIELGVQGGRSGIRDEKQLEDVLTQLRRWPEQIALCGIEIYEGILTTEKDVRAFLQHAVVVTRRLAREDRFHRDPVILSGAGSAWYDLVAEAFSQAELPAAVEMVLRPGCYLTHDVGVYRVAQEKIMGRNPIAREMQSGLLPALQVWAYVQSIPEDHLAIVGLGKRDAAFDAGLPIPASHFRPGAENPKPAPAHWSLTKLMDQHAFLHIDPQDDLRVGDMLAFDISHPCLTFDKWRYLTVLDQNYQVIDVVETFF